MSGNANIPVPIKSDNRSIDAKELNPLHELHELLIPELPTTIFGRPRVDEQLETSIAANKVTVVAAPGGFGKTIAVASYLKSSGREVVWVNLSPDQARQRELLADLESVLDCLRPLRMGQTTQEFSADELFLNARGSGHDSALRNNLVVVVDNFHLCSAETRDGLSDLIDSSSLEPLSYVFVGYPAIVDGLLKWISAQPNALVTANELCFTFGELDAICSTAASLVSPDELMRDTGGLPVAVSLHSKLQRNRAQPESKLHEILSGYVRIHVLSILPSEQIECLQIMSICEQFTAEFAAEVSCQPAAVGWVEQFASLGFLTRVCSDFQVNYQVHPVIEKHFQKVFIEHPERLRLVHKRLAKHLQSTDPISSMNHFRRAGLIAESIDVLKKRWVRLLLEDKYSEVAQWCAGLQEPFADEPAVLLISACAEDMMGHRSIARTKFVRAESLIESGSHDPRISAIRQLARLFLADDQKHALEASHDVRQLMESGNSVGACEKGSTQMLVGWAELRIGRHLGLAQELFYAATCEAKAKGESLLEERGTILQSTALVIVGKHQQAAKLLANCRPASDGLEGLESDLWAGGFSLSKGIMAFWDAEFSLANHELGKLFATDVVTSPFGALARFYAAINSAYSMDPAMRRRAAAGLQAIPRTNLYGQDWSIYRDTGLALLEDAAGNHAKAKAIAGKYTTLHDAPLIGVPLASILRKNGDYSGALQMLALHQQEPDRSYLRVSMLVAAALVCRYKGNAETAHEYCEAALEIGSRERIKLPFCDGDLVVRLLLADHLLRPTAYEAFITECLTFTQGNGLIKTLSSRETDVFRMLQTSRTVKEIADQLDVSVNTVKTHQRSIYRKLGVQNRREAQKVVP